MSKYYGLVFNNSNPGLYPSLAPTFLTFKNALSGADVSAPTIAQVSTVGVYGFTFTAAFPVYFRADGITIASTADRYVIGVIDPVSDVDSQLTAVGTTLQALGNTAVALGTTGIAFGNSNIALGMTNVAIGLTNVAIGTSNIALGSSNIALGMTNVALGITNFALGTTTVAIATSIYAASVSFTALNVSFGALLGNTSSSFGNDLSDPTTVFGYLKRMQEFNEGDQTFNKTSGTWTIQARNTSLIATRTLTNSSTEVTRS